MFLALCVTIFILLNILFILQNFPRRQGLPGPLKFPLIGALPQILRTDSRTFVAFQKLAEKYGDVMQLQIGLCNIIVISSYKAAKDICAKKCMTNRFQSPMIETRTFGKEIGLLFSGGTTFYKSKRFFIRTIHKYGFGKYKNRRMETVINEQVGELISLMAAEMKTNGKVEMSQRTFALPVINVIWGMLIGETFSQDDVKMKELLDIQEALIRSGGFAAGAAMAFPFLTNWFPKLTGKTDFHNKVKILQAFMTEIIDSRREILKRDGHAKCFVDELLKEIGKNKFTDEHGVVTLIDIFAAGGETSSNVLAFCCLHILVQPGVQEKVHEEIDGLLENRRHPNVADLEKFPYIRAVIAEVMRHIFVVPITPPRKSTIDFEYKGLVIPKGTPVLVNLAAILQEEKIWGDPTVFRPERFLDLTGKFDAQISEKAASFGFGHRICSGQRQAEAILLIFITRVFQKFKLIQLPDECPPTLEMKLGFTHSPHPFNVILQDRLLR